MIGIGDKKKSTLRISKSIEGPIIKKISFNNQNNLKEEKFNSILTIN